MNGWIDPASYGPHSRQWLGHYFRYRLARGFMEDGDTVLDAACGVGYGSRLLSDLAATVWAYDADGVALGRARARYDADNITWREADLDDLDELPAVDVAVSFETLEHLGDPGHFVELLHISARRLIVLSAPVTKTVGINPHHQHDFTEDELRSLVLRHPWTLYEEARQGPYLIIVAYRKDG